MFRANSWRQRAGVAVLLLVSLCAGRVALPHAEDPDASGPVLVNHDESAHYIGSAPTSSDADHPHCFLCHSLRSFCSGFEKYEQRESAVRAERLHPAAIVFADRLEWSLVPGRAPPA